MARDTTNKVFRFPPNYYHMTSATHATTNTKGPFLLPKVSSLIFVPWCFCAGTAMSQWGNYSQFQKEAPDTQPARKLMPLLYSKSPKLIHGKSVAWPYKQEWSVTKKWVLLRIVIPCSLTMNKVGEILHVGLRGVWHSMLFLLIPIHAKKKTTLSIQFDQPFHQIVFSVIYHLGNLPYGMNLKPCG